MCVSQGLVTRLRRQRRPTHVCVLSLYQSLIGPFGQVRIDFHSQNKLIVKPTHLCFYWSIWNYFASLWHFSLSQLLSLAVSDAKMSFGFGVSDFILLFQLAWTTVEGARKAVGEHDELTKEIYSLYTVLGHLHAEMSNPESVINLSGRNRCRELYSHIHACEQQLTQMNAILNKFNSLSEEERGGIKLWQKIRFGNGPTQDVAHIRLKISTYTTAISMSLSLLSLGSQGRMERRLSRQGGNLKGIRESVNLLVAKFSALSREGSTMTPYSNDDPDFWKSLRRELVYDGYPSKLVRKHKELIKGYVRELSMKGVLDDRMGRSLLSLRTDSFVAHTATQNISSENAMLDRCLADVGELQIDENSQNGGSSLNPIQPSPSNDVENDHPDHTDSRSISTISGISSADDEEEMPRGRKFKGKSKEMGSLQQTALPISNSLHPQTSTGLGDDQASEQEQGTVNRFGGQICDPASSYTYQLEQTVDRSARVERHPSYDNSQENSTLHVTPPMSPGISEMLERIEHLEALNRRQEQLLLAVSNQIESTEVMEGFKEVRGPTTSTSPKPRATATVVEDVSPPSSPEPQAAFAYVPSPTPEEESDLHFQAQTSRALGNATASASENERLSETHAEASPASPSEEKKKMIKFEDALGKKYVLPYHMVKTSDVSQNKTLGNIFLYLFEV
jgi:hypothetical protein